MSSSLRPVSDITGNPVSLEEVRQRLAGEPPRRGFGGTFDLGQAPLVGGKRSMAIIGSFLMPPSGGEVSSRESVCRILPPLF